MIDCVIYAVDFDGTLTFNDYPNIGKPNRVLIEFLKRERQKGNKVILNTLRTGVLLAAAVRWCSQHGLEFDAVNDNLPEVIEEWGENPRKVAAHYYIDDRNALVSCVRTKRISDDTLLPPHDSKKRYVSGQRYVSRKTEKQNED